MRIFDSSLGNLYEIILNLQEQGIGKSYYEVSSVDIQEGGLASEDQDSIDQLKNLAIALNGLLARIWIQLTQEFFPH